MKKSCVVLLLFILFSDCRNTENKIINTVHTPDKLDTVPYVATEKDSGIVYRIIAPEVLDSLEADTVEYIKDEHLSHDEELELFILNDTLLKKYFTAIAKGVGIEYHFKNLDLLVESDEKGIRLETEANNTYYYIKLEESEFISKGHKLTYHKEEEYSFLAKINGRPFHGTDGGIPDRVISSFSVKINGKKVDIPDTAFNDLYQPNLYASKEGFSPLNIFIDRTNTYLIIEHSGSDAAGSYTAYWIFKNGVYLGRQMLDFC